MDTKQLSTFMKVVETGNLSEAAAIMHMSQPAVTAQIQKLEEETGVLLFRRNGRSLTPNMQGRILYHMAQELAFSDSLSRICMDGSVDDCITIALDVYSDYFLKIVGEYSKRVPRCCFVFHTDILNFKGRSYTSSDLILTYPYKVRDKETLSLDRQDRLYAILPSGHPLAQREELYIDDLRAEYFVFLKGSDHSGYESTYRECQNAGFSPKIRLVVDIPATKYAAIGSGCGIGLIYNTETSLVSTMTNCVLVELKRRGVDKTVCLAWDEQGEAKAHDFINFVKAYRLGLN